MPGWLSTAVSIIVPTLTLFLLIVHYVNQRERRHGEIIDSISKNLNKAIALKKFTEVIDLNIGTLRLMLRQLPDSNLKFQCIEMMGLIVKKSSELLIAADAVIKNIREIDPTKHNRTEALYQLQKFELTFIGIERDGNNLEDLIKKTINTLSQIIDKDTC